MKKRYFERLKYSDYVIKDIRTLTQTTTSTPYDKVKERFKYANSTSNYGLECGTVPTLPKVVIYRKGCKEAANKVLIIWNEKKK